MDGGLRCRIERRGVSRCCECTNGVGLNTTRESEHYARCPSHCRCHPHRSHPHLPIAALSPLLDNPCGVSAVYGDRRRHLPSSLALPLRSGSLGYERRDFLPDEDAIPTAARLFPSHPLLHPDLSLMYKNKLVRRAFYCARGVACDADSPVFVHVTGKC